MKKSNSQPSIDFTVDRGGVTYSATYTIQGGRVSIAYVTKKSKVLGKSAPVGGSAETTARTLLRELLLEEAAV